MTYPQPPQEPERYGDSGQQGHGPAPSGYDPWQQQYQGGYGQYPYGAQQYGAPGDPPAGAERSWGSPQGGWGYGPGGRPNQCPGTVVAAAVMTYVGAG